MALWDSLVNKTNPTALAFNRMLNNKTYDAMSRYNGLLNRVLGKPSEIGGPDAKSKEIVFEKMQRTDGVKASVRFMDAAASFTYPSDGAQEYATATLAYDGDIWGEQEFLLAHGTLKHAIVHSELTIVDGDSKKGASLMDEYAQYFDASIRKELSTGILSANAPLRTSVGGIVWAIDDGGNTAGPAAVMDGATGGNASYAAYGLLDRSATANADFCPYVGASTGEFTIQTLQKGINMAAAAGGNVTVCPVGVNLYSKAQDLARSMQYVQAKGDWDSFGGKYVNLGGVDFCLEAGTNAPTSELILIDPETWVFIMNSKGFNVSFDDAPDLVASKRATIEFWAQFICRAPWKNAKLTGVTV